MTDNENRMSNLILAMADLQQHTKAGKDEALKQVKFLECQCGELRIALAKACEKLTSIHGCPQEHGEDFDPDKCMDCDKTISAECWAGRFLGEE